MGKQETPDPSARPPGMIVTSITVVDLPRRRADPRRARLTRRRARLAIVAAIGVAAVAAIVVVALPGGGASGRRALALQPGERAAIADGLGYPYPLHCLTIAVFADNPDYANAELDRTGGCQTYHGYINATLHRVDGRWRLVLDEGQLYVPDERGAVSRAGPSSVGNPLGCVSPATLVHDPSFASMGLDRGVCAQPVSP
jgi:hypothetical protein